MTDYCPRCDKEFEGDWQKHDCYVGITYNERLIQQMPKDKISDFASNSVIAKEIWNAAIEAAAVHCDEMGEEARISENVRGLKK